MPKINHIKRFSSTVLIFLIVISTFFLRPVLAAPNGFPNEAWTPQDVVNLVGLIRNMFLIIGAISIVIFIIWAGIGFFTSQGNPTKLQTAKKRLLWTTVAAAIILGTFVIITTIRAFLAKQWF